MTVAIVSDIHGNLPALEAVVADAKARGCVNFVNLGDLLSGPLWPAETADYLMAREWPTIRGNHERQLLTIEPECMIESDHYARTRLDDRHMDWLRALPTTFQLDGDIFLCHGTPANDVEYFLHDVGEAGLRPASDDQICRRAQARSENIIFCGHTHLPGRARLGGRRLVVNPGSVGLQAYEDNRPFPHKIEAGSPAARYAVLHSGDVQFVEVAYDHHAAAAQADRNGRPDWAFALREGRCPI